MTKQDLDTMVHEYRELKTMKSELEDQISSIECGIRKYMEEGGIDKISGTDYSITYKRQSRRIWDTKKLESALGDKSGEYRKESTFMSLKVK